MGIQTIQKCTCDVCKKEVNSVKDLAPLKLDAREVRSPKHGYINHWSEIEAYLCGDCALKLKLFLEGKKQIEEISDNYYDGEIRPYMSYEKYKEIKDKNIEFDHSVGGHDMDTIYKCKCGNKVSMYENGKLYIVNLPNGTRISIEVYKCPKCGEEYNWGLK